MTEQAIQTSHTTDAQSEQKASHPGSKQPRQLVRFTFYKLDSQWQLLPEEKRQQGKQELLAIFGRADTRARRKNASVNGSLYSVSQYIKLRTVDELVKVMMSNSCFFSWRKKTCP